MITTNSGCGYDKEVGGGCSGGSGSGSQVPTGCYQTTKPAKYITAEMSTNGVCKRDANNGTVTVTGDDGFDFDDAFSLTKRAAGRIDRRC